MPRRARYIPVSEATPRGLASRRASNRAYQAREKIRQRHPAQCPCAECELKQERGRRDYSADEVLRSRESRFDPNALSFGQQFDEVV